MTNPANFYEADEPAWLDHTAKQVAEGRWAEIDAESLIDFLESGSRQARDEVRGRLLVLLQARLKWDFIRDSRVLGVSRVILAQAHALTDLLAVPSLGEYAATILPDTYRFARELSCLEAFPDEHVLPRACPYTFADLTDAQIVLRQPLAKAG